MNILITGAAGFVSRALVQELERVSPQHEVLLLDRVQPQDATVFVPGSDERQASPLDVTAHRYIQAEILDEAALAQAMTGVDAVVHLAAAVSGYPDGGIHTFRVNALGTYMVLDVARRQGVKRVLVASSINAFGTFYWRISGKPITYERLPLDEDVRPVPEDPYSLSKLVNEETCAAFSRAYDLSTAAMRFGVVWSREMYEHALHAGLPPTTAWSDDLLSWVHIDDIACGLRQALEAPTLPQSGVYILSGADTRCPEPTLDVIARLRPDLLPITRPLTGRAPLLAIDHAYQAFAYAPGFRLGST